VSVHFEHQDLRVLKTAQFDLILANLPYIGCADAHLNQGDLRYEPLLALTDGHDGLSLLAVLCEAAPALLAPGGAILLEHGYDQAEAVRSLLLAAGLEKVASWRDLAGIERVTGATRGAGSGFEEQPMRFPRID
jgi:release factor glutamine methyltransferase